MRHALLREPGSITSRLGLGCLPFSGFYGHCATGTAVELIHQAMDGGVTVLDVTDQTPAGHGLRAVREALTTRRDEAFLAVHGRAVQDGDGSGAVAAAGATAEIQACEATLRRLDTDRLDLYYVHRCPAGTPIEDRVGALAALVAAGKVRYLGVCDAAPEEIVRAHSAHPIAALAVEYSLAARAAEDRQLPVARYLGLTVVACRPLSGGWLTGRLERPRTPGERRILDGLRDAAAAMDIGVGRLALAWLLAQGEDIVPVPGTRDLVHLEMNLRSEDVELPPEVAARLTRLTQDSCTPGSSGPESPGLEPPAAPESPA